MVLGHEGVRNWNQLIIRLFPLIQLNVVVLLMSEGADWKAVDADGDTVLHFACIKEVPCGRHDQTLEYLLSSPARALKDSCNKRGDTPIIVAARHVLVMCQNLT